MNRLKEHGELIAALFSGVLILTTWALKGYLSPTTWVTLHVIAFAVGGFAKAKEGIEETIANKELNVEMLMIFAAIGSAAIGYWTEGAILRSEEHTSELQSRGHLVCRLLLEKK